MKRPQQALYAMGCCWAWARPQGQGRGFRAERGADMGRFLQTPGARWGKSLTLFMFWTLQLTSILCAMHQDPSAPDASSGAAPEYTISDLAKEFDLTTRAIRFYEDMGLLQPRREGSGGRTRIYSARDRARLKLTLRAKRLGLSLVEAKEIIDLYDSPRDSGVQLEKFLSVLAQHRRQLEGRMQDLQVTLDEVRAQEKEAQAMLRKLQARKAT